PAISASKRVSGPYSRIAIPADTARTAAGDPGGAGAASRMGSGSGGYPALFRFQSDYARRVLFVSCFLVAARGRCLAFQLSISVGKHEWISPAERSNVAAGPANGSLGP